LDSAGGWWVAALLVTMGALYEGVHSGFIDAIYASFILAAARLGFDAEEEKDFLTLGLFCGLAMATKYTGLVALPALMLCAAWPKQGSWDWQFFKRAAIAGISAGVVASPIYLRNWILLGSPIYPPPAIITRFLHVKYFSPDSLQNFYTWVIHRGHGHGRGLPEFLLLPFNLTYHTADFHGAGGIGLVPLAFGPLGLIAARGNAFARRLALLAALLLGIWFVTSQESRYLIHVYAIAAIFGVIGWRHFVSSAGKRGTILGAIVVSLSLLYGLYMVGAARKTDLHSVFSPSFAQKRRQMEIPFLSSFTYLNRDPSVTRLLILDRSVPAYYSDKNYLKPFGQWGEQVLPDAATPNDVLAKLSELRISHVLDVRSEISGFRVPSDYPGVILVFERPDQRVYKVTGTN
jgi:4-amino-4-deoxy-L-arabinose transferase-like glycosyltransferase